MVSRPHSTGKATPDYEAGDKCIYCGVEVVKGPLLNHYGFPGIECPGPCSNFGGRGHLFSPPRDLRRGDKCERCGVSVITQQGWAWIGGQVQPRRPYVWPTDICSLAPSEETTLRRDGGSAST